MVDDLLAGPRSDVVGVTNSIGALWSVGGGAWVLYLYAKANSN